MFRIIAVTVWVGLCFSMQDRTIRADDRLEEARRREAVAAQALEREILDQIALAGQLESKKGIELLNKLKEKLAAEGAILGIVKKIDLQQKIESKIKEINEPKKQSIVGQLPPSKREQDEAIKALFDKIIDLQNKGQLAEAQQLTNKLISSHPELVQPELNRVSSATAQSVKDYDQIKKDQAAGSLGALNEIDKSATPMSGNISYPPDWKKRMDERTKRLAQKLNPLTDTERMLLRLLNDKTKEPIYLKDVPFEQALKIIEKEMGVGLLLRKSTLDEMRITYDQLVTVNVFKGATKRTLLAALTEQLGLTYIVKNQQIEIVSKERASTELVTRVFPVDGMFGNTSTNTPDMLMNYIMDNVEPQSWKKNGGQGTITYYAPANCFIIRNSSEVINSLSNFK